MLFSFLCLHTRRAGPQRVAPRRFVLCTYLCGSCCIHTTTRQCHIWRQRALLLLCFCCSFLRAPFFLSAFKAVTLSAAMIEMPCRGDEPRTREGRPPRRCWHYRKMSSPVYGSLAYTGSSWFHPWMMSSPVYGFQVCLFSLRFFALSFCF